METISYYRVSFKNAKSEIIWTIIKTPYDMSIEEIKKRMMNDSEVVEVKSVLCSDNKDYSLDFTIDSNK